MQLDGKAIARDEMEKVKEELAMQTMSPPPKADEGVLVAERAQDKGKKSDSNQQVKKKKKKKKRVVDVLDEVAEGDKQPRTSSGVNQ